MVSMVALLVLYSLFIKQLCFATDTITKNTILRDGDTLVSDRGIFALGFFSPGNSKLRYVGIWYNKIPEQTVVWVANRNSPVYDSSSGVMKFNGRRNLAIFNGNAVDPVWSTNITIPIGGTSTVCKLLDSGNLVLLQQNKGGLLWQSFDHPTNTLLPGMKVGLSFKSGLNWSFTSWKSRDDPSIGDFVLSLQGTKSPEIFLKKWSTLIWRSGPWNGESWSGVPLIIHFEKSLVNDPDETSFSFSMLNTSILSRISMDDLGFIQRWTWIEATQRWSNDWSAPADLCDDYGKCGSFGSCKPNNALLCPCLPGFEPKYQVNWNFLDRTPTQGCVRKRELLCGKGDGFLKLEKIKLPDTSNARVDMSLGIKDCEIECRNNCSCTGYACPYVNRSGCLVWFGDLVDIREYTDGGQDFFVRVDAIELGLPRKERLRKQLPIFDLNSILVATENFSVANKLGAGGFGSVYKTWELWKEGRILELVDPAMSNSFPKEVVLRFIQVGILCVQEKAKDRPTMSDVIFMLRNETQIPPLKQPAFVLISNSNSANASAGPDPSLNEMTMTIVRGR
ncbi:hypothetical protein Syun_027134 [Stephania yunnanensis]|uniref:Uncharacterized protein n=1 Tax=Stephania yunnanensis TaxID=152371 RepID=A0AAP0EKJ9_9MAGN